MWKIPHGDGNVFLQLFQFFSQIVLCRIQHMQSMNLQPIKKRDQNCETKTDSILQINAIRPSRSTFRFTICPIITIIYMTNDNERYRWKISERYLTELLRVASICPSLSDKSSRVEFNICSFFICNKWRKHDRNCKISTVTPSVRDQEQFTRPSA